MTPNPIHKVLSTLRSCRVRFLLMGGQACVFYGAAEFSRDTDIVLLADAANLKRLADALKTLRAEPIVSLYEQGKVKHIGPLPALETQLCTWVPEASAKSPDRLDALVWGLTDLFLSGEATHQCKVWV